MSGVMEDRSVACHHAAARQFDPAFKLFGSTIPVSSLRDCKTMTDGKMKEEESMVVVVADSYTRSCSQVVGDDAPESELGSSSGSNDGCDEAKPNSGIERTAAPVPIVEYGAPVNCGDTQRSLDDDHGDATQGKVRKKQGKPVPCPRCDSLDTKFCYYNNYNVNQPRHFCKNCQRYWTAGGSLRNVPVGAGRRKNKHSTTAFPDGLVARDDEPDAAHQLFSRSESSFVGVNRQMKVLTPPPRLHARPLDVSSLAASDGPSSSVILNFGQENLLCESIGATSSNVHRSELLHELGRVSGKVCVRVERDSCSSGLLEAESNLLYEKQIQMQDDRSSAANMSNEADATIGLQPFGKPSVRSTVTTQPVESLSVESKMDSTIRTELPTNTNTSLGWAPGGPFAFVSGQWQHVSNIGWSNIALPEMVTDLNPSSNIISANQPQSKASVNHPPWSVALGSPWVGIPGSVIQNPAWGPYACSGAWAVPWAPAAAAAVAATNPICGSSTLGKHPREEEEPEDEKQGSLWVPKTLRIHDLEEAGRSSIWSTVVLGNKTESLTSGNIFTAFQPKKERTESDYPHVQTRHSNPAALTRSMAFQECIFSSQDAEAQCQHERNACTACL